MVSCQSGYAQVVELLLRAGADRDKGLTNGATPLFGAAQKGHAQVVEVLLRAGVDREKVNRMEQPRCI